MVQTILVVVIFIAALGYLIFIVRNQFLAKEGGCPKNCGCSSIDLEKIENKIKTDLK
ncbi:MAG TPA: FeoB-associated Cys-rich membrane protein [Cytophagaceae bacterium]|jgi:hypothetical protein|nr:FeoB-associated Cys-rich membrane protein [Cytophagaceae bacterium]